MLCPDDDAGSCARPHHAPPRLPRRLRRRRSARRRRDQQGRRDPANRGTPPCGPGYRPTPPPSASPHPAGPPWPDTHPPETPIQTGLRLQPLPNELGEMKRRFRIWIPRRRISPLAAPCSINAINNVASESLAAENAPSQKEAASTPERFEMGSETSTVRRGYDTTRPAG